MTDQEIYARVFAVELHSFATHDNTDLFRQVGNSGVYLEQIAHLLKDVPDGMGLKATVTAFELKTPTTDDRISLRFMPENTVMQANATYLCVPRTVWTHLYSNRRNPRP
jgi:hypothetical protein